ncbi:hypothetical protein FXO38_13626 [Capsicum annuum]|nr:hypothetical protein FXO38_13626 [Capsicum annuum]
MEWICNVLKEASTNKGNTVRRWKWQELSSQLFCAKNFNSKGRFVSIVNAKGRNRAVLIITEVTFNAGWWDEAIKIERFIFCKAARRINECRPMLVDEEIPYAASVANGSPENST